MWVESSPPISYETIVARLGEGTVKKMIDESPALYLVQKINIGRVGKRIEDSPPDIQQAARNLKIPSLASLEGRDNAELMSVAFKTTKNAMMVSLASNRLLNDTEFALKMIQIQAFAYSYFDESVRENPEVKRAYLNAFQWLSESTR